MYYGGSIITSGTPSVCIGVDLWRMVRRSRSVKRRKPGFPLPRERQEGLPRCDRNDGVGSAFICG